MPLRPPAGFIRPGYDPLKVPDAPTIGTATAGDAQASVTFTAPSNVGGSAISAYYAVSNPGQITSSGASSPVTVTGLTNGTSYTFTVWALNTYGPSPYSAASGSVTPAPLQRGLFAGGDWSGYSNVIQYISINSTGNAIDFGDLLFPMMSPAGCGSTTRGLFSGGFEFVSGSTFYNVIEYVTFASIGNAIDFGDLTVGRRYAGAANSTTRAVTISGRTSSGTSNIIDYVTIASLGNATDFGDTTGFMNECAACSSSTRAVFIDDSSGSTLGYITIATTGNATYFGDLTQRMVSTSSCSSATRGLFGGSSLTDTNTISYITIATTGNATDFGDLTVGTGAGPAACSSSTRGVFAGGNSGANVIGFVTIATTGNATDFGDLIGSERNLAGCSNVNGGVQ